MGNWKWPFAALALTMCQANAWSATALGEINIQMYGNIVDFTCVAEGSDSDKTVTLGTADEAAQHHGEPHAAHALYAEADWLSAGLGINYVFREN